ncbi:hypothetical protein B0T16DRAFT_435717 [Cercophora newfieldiana]|uniref:ATP-grasp domain-containing protein n=1 Tax=Cercophora newfieldiana TaxID=92897 RepID=A0AA39YAE5_9PEZI|nr:hypothetical protein B0T16DRAFT_435717 [Cercophora newfieldiana]
MVPNDIGLSHSRCCLLEGVVESPLTCRTANLYCHWELKTLRQDMPCRILNLSFRPRFRPHSDAISQWPQYNRTDAARFVERIITKCWAIDNCDAYAAEIKLLLPAVEGYVVRNDIVERRFLTCQWAKEVVDFTTTGSKIEVSPSAFEAGDEGVSLLHHALSTAVGAIHVDPAVDNTENLDAEISARLSFPWIVDRPLPKRRLALVDGKGYPHTSTGQLGIYRAAKALGIEIVVVDREGHWVQNHPLASIWRDEFAPCDLTPDDDLPDRIVRALSQTKQPVDCITTYSDRLLPAIARAAERMGLHTNPSEAFEIAHDKHRTRALAPATNIQVFSVGSPDELADLLRCISHRNTPLRYPLVVKPTAGASSEGVCKVHSETELLAAVRADHANFPGTRCVIETYVSGPEVDANFVLLNGELLFSEVNDDFPSTADTRDDGTKYYGPEAKPADSFAELSTAIPSALPADEIALIKSSLTETLLNMGFRDGVFHLEARVMDSSMHFAKTADGIDLVPRELSPAANTATPTPSVFLVEVNPRAPGHRETIAIEYTYGIDYWALHMLSALHKKSSPPTEPNGHGHDEDDQALQTIIRALAHPFPEEYQYPVHVAFIPLNRGGTFVRAKELPEELMRYVPEGRVHFEEGEVFAEPGENGEWPFVAYFIVLAKVTGAEGRRQARVVGDLVREGFEYVME